MRKLVQKVSESEVKVSAKNGKNYKVVEFANITSTVIHHPILGDITVNAERKSVNITLWENNINNKMDLGYAEEVGAYFEGDIVSSSVQEYLIDGKGVTVDTTVVFGNTTSSDWDTKVANVFKQREKSRNKVDVPTSTLFVPADAQV